MGDENKAWYIRHIRELDPNGNVVVVNEEISRITYSQEIKSDEDLTRPLDPEELVRALTLVILTSSKYRYEPRFFTIEKHYSIGRPSEKRAEIDLIISEQDELAFSVWDFKSPDAYPERRYPNNPRRCRLSG
jgi:DNA-binding NarL/FixJ family response regulator